jgi:hypothetical protein
LLRLVPSLALESVEQQVRDSRLRRYACVDGDVENGFLIKLVRNRHGERIDRLLSVIGHRFHRFGATALIQNGKAVKIGYFLWLGDTRDHNMYQGIGVDAAQYSRAGWDVIREKILFLMTTSRLTSRALRATLLNTFCTSTQL